ncbi:MFS-type transporter SLC18B1-like isoform X2 [Tachypleus tridentatus]|uniref:MFS-type transporter SLC18B1-like isoform X2 n=1 Tax=Tachypleus tridentatus TaxID=6853 RepID=UPI003FD5A1FD
MGKRDETLHKKHIIQHQKDESRKLLPSSRASFHENSKWSDQNLSYSFDQNSTNLSSTKRDGQGSCDNSFTKERVNFKSESSRSGNWISTENDVVKKGPGGFSRRQISVLCSLGIGNLLVGACYSLLAPFFPQELPVLKPKFLTYSGLFVCGSCSILFGFLDKAKSGSTFLILAIAVRIIEGLGGGAYYTASPAICVSEFSGKTTTAFSTMEMMFGVGMVIGPTVGGGLYQVGGYILPFLVLGLLLLFSSLMIFFILPDIEAEVNTSGGYKRLLLDPKMVTCVMVLISGFIFFGYNDATLEPHLRKFDLKPAVLGMIFVAVGGVYACTTPFWGYLCDKGSNPRLMCLVGCVTCFISLLLVGPVPFFNFEADLWLIILR